MKRSDIENMPAGIEIDLLIHIDVMKREPPLTGYYTPQYSRDISCAWEVAEKVRMFVLPFGKTDWCSTNTRNNRGVFENMAVADTAPLAICRAALLVTLKDLK